MKITSIDTIPTLDPYHRDTNQETKSAIEINPETKEVRVFQDDDDNATPEPVWNRRILQATFTGHPVKGNVRSYLESKNAQTLLNRIVEGHAVEWDGSNHVGSLTNDAELAWEQLIEELGNLDYGDGTGYEYWGATDWFSTLTATELGVTAEMTDDEIHTLADNLEASALDEGNVVVEGTESYLLDLRRDLREGLEA